MKHLIVVLCCLAMSCRSTDLEIDRGEVGGYTKEVILTIPLGTDKGEIGRREVADGIIIDGPAAFAVDDYSRIYLLDDGNSKIVIFDKSGKLISEFDINDGVFHGSKINVDETTQLIYVSDAYLKLLYVYSLDGNIVRKIKHSSVSTASFEVADGIISFRGGVGFEGMFLTVDKEAVYIGTGEDGEEIYIGHMWNDYSRNNFGKYSNTVYLSDEPFGWGGIFAVVSPDSSTKELKINVLPSTYEFRFIGETPENDALFLASLHKKGLYVLKYNSSLELVSVIDDEEFKLSRLLVVVNESIYTLTNEGEEVVIRKWIME